VVAHGGVIGKGLRQRAQFLEQCGEAREIASALASTSVLNRSRVPWEWLGWG
jgi:hypothetical protein